MIRTIPAFALLAFGGLSACGGGAVEPTAVERFNALATEYNGLGADYNGAAVVPSASLTATGTATYDGVARIRVDTIAQTQVLGEARIAANFNNDTVAGEFGNFFGRANGGAIVPWTETTPVTASGVIDVTQAGGQYIQTLMNGALRSANGDTMVLGPMQLDGTFRDTAPSVLSAPDAMVLQSGTGNIRLNGLNYGNELGNACETCVIVVAED